MSTHQEVWITLRIKSQLPIEDNAERFSKGLAECISNGSLTPTQQRFFDDARAFDVIEVKEERHIYGTQE